MPYGIMYAQFQNIHCIKFIPKKGKKLCCNYFCGKKFMQALIESKYFDPCKIAVQSANGYKSAQNSKENKLHNRKLLSLIINQH